MSDLVQVVLDIMLEITGVSPYAVVPMSQMYKHIPETLSFF
jgi:hypothetical protein